VATSKTIAIVATTLASVFARFASLASQAIVGWYLTEEQVGTYAFALGVMGITSLFRGGGMALYLPSVKPDEIDGKVPSFLAWSTIFMWGSGLATIAVALAAPQLATRFENFGLDGLQYALLLLAARQMLTPLAMIARIRVSVERRFTELARIDTVNAILRIAMTWIAAREGGGVLALAIPYFVQILVDLVAIGTIGGVKRTDFRFRGVSLRQVGAILLWPLIAGAMMSIRSEVVYLILGIAIPAAALGVFYFAFQLANQPTMLLAGALQNVLAPYQAEDRGNREAERLGMERVFSGSMLFVPVTTIATASLFPSLEALIWGGRWASAQGCLMYLCIGATYSTVSALMTGPLIGLRRFKALTMFEATKIVGTVGGGIVGAAIIAGGDDGPFGTASDATIVGACVGIAMGAVAVAQLAWIMRRVGSSAGDIGRNLLFGPMLALLTALASQSIGHSIRESFGLPAGRLGAAVELASVGFVYCGLIMLAIRFTAEPTLRETVGVLPAPAARAISRFLGLR
jgi:O-antigen/teichoic acid export membrane protein